MTFLKMQNISKTDKLMPISNHFMELKKRIFYCCIFFVICFGFSYYFSDKIAYFIAKPLLKFTGQKMIYTSITEPFFVYIKIAFASGIGFSIPFFMLQVYFFVLPGLHYHEKKWVTGMSIAFFIMFLLGVCMMYYGILPLAIIFLINYNKSQSFSLELQAKLSDYIEMILQLSIGFGFAFELPVLLIILAKIGIITHFHLQKFRRFAIVIIFVVAAIVTPPDILSQIILGSVMIMFYEITILICKFIEKK